MKLDRVPSRILVELGLIGAVATGEACTQVSTCLSMQGPTSGTGVTGDTDDSTDSATSTSGATGQDEISTSACLSPPDPTLDDSGSGGTTVFTTGPCLSPPEDSSGSGSGSESGSSGEGSGSGSESGSGSDTGMPAPDDPDEVARRVLDSGTLPADVAARLRGRGAKPRAGE